MQLAPDTTSTHGAFCAFSDTFAWGATAKLNSSLPKCKGETINAQDSSDSSDQNNQSANQFSFIPTSNSLYRMSTESYYQAC